MMHTIRGGLRALQANFVSGEFSKKRAREELEELESETSSVSSNEEMDDGEWAQVYQTSRERMWTQKSEVRKYGLITRGFATPEYSQIDKYKYFGTSQDRGVARSKEHFGIEVHPKSLKLHSCLEAKFHAFVSKLFKLMLTLTFQCHAVAAAQ